LAARTDIAILQEIVRVIQKRDKVPGKVKVRNKDYEITYLDDHRQRMEDAIQRRDTDRLEMLFGQLTGRVKYQLLKPRSKRAKQPRRAGARG
jgi:hypothetical protein